MEFWGEGREGHCGLLLFAGLVRVWIVNIYTCIYLLFYNILEFSNNMIYPY